MDKPRFVYITYIRTTPEKLWQALIDPEFTRRYWVRTWQECEWKLGASWKMMGPDGQMVNTGEVLEIDPPRKLVLSWRNEFMPDAKAEGDSRLTYELEPQGRAVKLTLTQVMETPRGKSVFIETAASGWPLVLASLKSLLETGECLEATREWRGDTK